MANKSATVQRQQNHKLSSKNDHRQSRAMEFDKQLVVSLSLQECLLAPVQVVAQTTTYNNMKAQVKKERERPLFSLSTIE